MPFTRAARLRMVSALGPLYFSAHTGFPGELGEYEVAGGTPEYSRVFAGVSSEFGEPAAVVTPVYLDIPRETVVRYVGIWDSLEDGVLLAHYLVPEAEFLEQGTYLVAHAEFEIT